MSTILFKEGVNDLQDWIGLSKFNRVFDYLIDFCRSHMLNEPLTQLIKQKGTWTDLKRKTILGTISRKGEKESKDLIKEELLAILSQLSTSHGLLEAKPVHAATTSAPPPPDTDHPLPPLPPPKKQPPWWQRLFSMNPLLIVCMFAQEKLDILVQPFVS
ncbi:MAG: hypothetical protein AAF587_02425 [Bacteroidota bacterium]